MVTANKWVDVVGWKCMEMNECNLRSQMKHYCTTEMDSEEM